MIPTPEQAWELLCEYNEGDFHRKHGRIVGDVLRWYANELGYGDEADFWQAVGILHDLDFEQWPEQHCTKEQELLRERGIDPAVAGALCREVHYAVGERRFFAIGFRNDAGGWELRSPQFKGSSAPKSITTFDRHGDTALLFEGFFDLLSYLTLQHKPEPIVDTAVLNSVVNLPRALPFLARHTTIHAFLDNDEAGRLTLERLRSALPDATVIDRAESYRAHKDLNESLRLSAKVSRTPRRRGRKL